MQITITVEHRSDTTKRCPDLLCFPSPTRQGIGNGSFKDWALSESEQVEKEQTPRLNSPSAAHAEGVRGQRLVQG